MKLDVLLFSYRNGPTSALQSIMAMCSYTRTKGVDVQLGMYGNALVHRSRNQALVRVREDADYALFVDDDMLPAPPAAIGLMEHGRPVVSALCTTRTPPVELACKVYDSAADQFCPIDRMRGDRLFSGQIAAGTAFLLISKPTIDKLIQYYVSASDWMQDRRREMDRLRVRGDARETERQRKEKIRRARFEAEKMVRVFDFPVTDDELQLGEDICLSRRLLQLGIPVAIDTEVTVGHVGEYAYGPWDVIREVAERVA